ncbi:ubiquinol-cytochrome c reductase iron-sulfur subunit [Actinokineospora globicatena]|uniref:Cytochrome bc1 complex Rieske iron-sulfur subunit n=1 Tax=Actinokineospora globicatena TaxID=103729 RepID=A0A9W6V6H7_9PSEU|nr:ubiquinol-cytochrome c reductase iron-sulfur subunit [Actinokineospora globicatena]MCP2302507.1 menaquinol-cytochrome c reductase iron-sulfur subunit precursor [Actinokineospora globicatena]GLW75808.1 ubiquinol-cytochrome c reductase iron-sulfur subunit [Actinokineospora globicatena]GLW82646.1 ubiquinol-cytochrome c reductase iron-sulfur subunit [Actinokineospora globicatena]GLW91595.1 ubiquinol-cytochrome c reductase iron-sulfur subunit [Actinokineospora globicatena]
MSSTDPQQLPSEEELAGMSREELVRLGGKLDGVEIIEYPDPWPVKGTRAEKRAERLVALWYLLAAVGGLAFAGVFLFWPSAYTAPDTDGYFLYSLYTPLLGASLGLSVASVGIGTLLYTKKFIPHEIAVQQRHEGASAELDKATILAHLADAGTRNGIARRSLIKRTAGLGAGAMGLGVGVFALGGLIRDPWAQTDSPNSLWHTGWKSDNGERVFLRRATGDPEEVVLVKPSDLDAGGMETVFPFRESERKDHEALSKALKRSDNPVMIIRLRPEDAAKVIKHQGQEDFNYGDYYAYTKICSHLGCPTSLYEQRTNRILCPCHQSQFNALEYAKPIFGPATRKLAQLPIAVDEETGYLYARSDFIEPVGPAFWERKS